MGKSSKPEESRDSKENHWFERIRTSRSLEFAPVPISIDGQRKRQPVQQTSWWQLFTGCLDWLAYHNIQIRWHIERRIARLFHRRWGTK